MRSKELQGPGGGCLNPTASLSFTLRPRRARAPRSDDSCTLRSRRDLRRQSPHIPRRARPHVRRVGRPCRLSRLQSSRHTRLAVQAAQDTFTSAVSGEGGAGLDEVDDPQQEDRTVAQLAHVSDLDRRRDVREAEVVALAAVNAKGDSDHGGMVAPGTAAASGRSVVNNGSLTDVRSSDNPTERRPTWPSQGWWTTPRGRRRSTRRFVRSSGWTPCGRDLPCCRAQPGRRLARARSMGVTGRRDAIPRRTPDAGLRRSRSAATAWPAGDLAAAQLLEVGKARPLRAVFPTRQAHRDRPEQRRKQAVTEPAHARPGLAASDYRHEAFGELASRV
jgi:hypothetical protein